MKSRLEEIIACHCAPALAGIKPANLVSCRIEADPSLEQELEQLNRRLNVNGILFRPVCRCKNRLLLLVYRKRTLERHLENPRLTQYLRRAGYPEGPLEELLLHLESRLAAGGEEFPHEIGIFLGYPPEDVEGFRRDRGRNCKFSGYWKVYGDAERTKELFARYTRCRNARMGIVQGGRSIAVLFRAA